VSFIPNHRIKSDLPFYFFFIILPLFSRCVSVTCTIGFHETDSHTCVAIYTSMPISWRKYYNNYHHYY